MYKVRYRKKDLNKLRQIDGALQPAASAMHNKRHYSGVSQQNRLAQIEKAQIKKKLRVIPGNLHQYDHTTFYLCFILIVFIILIFSLQYIF